MKKEALKELQALPVEQLEDKLIELREEQFKLRLRHKTGQLEQTHEVRRVRRDIARVKQIIGSKKQG
ncbi:MAG: 50S ribosomal protein L29 [Gammaproteobacteria bacterium]|nr:MAG: 50S ribosomal protein L29 [Gammaproteobacteria bacterium]